MSRTEDQSVLISRVDTSLRRTSFFVVFSAVAYLSVGEQIVNALFGWGAFSADDARLVWLVLGAYSLGLPAIAISRQLPKHLVMPWGIPRARRALLAFG